MKKRAGRLLAGALAAAALLPGGTAAAYSASSDTGVEALDYIENARRTERENRLTEEQKALQKAAEDMQANLRYPWDPKDKSQSVPVAFEGDDLSYDERTGDFVAKGSVHILMADAHSFDGADAEGSLAKKEVYFPEKIHVVQMTEGQSRVTLDGFKTRYNYGTRTGTMEEAKGKVDRYYITGKRFEFYPDHYVVYKGTATKCSAVKPDYDWAADKITIYPNDRIVMEKMRFRIKGRTVYTRDNYTSSIDPSKEGPKYPRVGYDSDDGAWVSYDIHNSIAKNTALNLNLLWMNREGWRSHYDVTWQNADMRAGIRYGHYEDGNNNWIRKLPSFFWDYGAHIAGTPFSYSLGFEKGRWYGNGVHSTHTAYTAGLSRDPIAWDGYTFHSYLGYSITQEGYDHSRVDGMNADFVLTKEFDARWAAYTSFHYRTTTTRNSVFEYGLDDYKKKLEGGVSYRLTERDRFVIGTRYNLDDGEMDDIDYYWYHDMHCTSLILRYRSMANTWNIKLEFTPW